MSEFESVSQVGDRSDIVIFQTGCVGLYTVKIVTWSHCFKVNESRREFGRGWLSNN